MGIFDGKQSTALADQNRPLTNEELMRRQKAALEPSQASIHTELASIDAELRRLAALVVDLQHQLTSLETRLDVSHYR